MADTTLRGPGVYCITHIPSGLIYVGAAVDVSSRWRVHRYGLRHRKHHSRKLQALWNKDGEASITFKILEMVDPSQNTLLDREQFWLDELTPCNPAIGLNTLPFAHSTYGRVISDATREKLGACNRGRKLTPEHRAALINANTGRSMPQSVKDKLGATNKGRIITPEWRAKLAAANCGKVVSLETRQKISASTKGRKLSPERVAKMKGFTRQHTQETKEKISRAKKGIPANPIQVAKAAASRRGLKKSAETRAKIGAAHRGKTVSLETRAKQSAAQRRRFGTFTDHRQLTLSEI